MGNTERREALGFRSVLYILTGFGVVLLAIVMIVLFVAMFQPIA